MTEFNLVDRNEEERFTRQIEHAKWMTSYQILPPFQNIRCFSFVKQMYLDIF
jgi:hypothetical protein